jgi:hypothetical protein
MCTISPCKTIHTTWVIYLNSPDLCINFYVYHLDLWWDLWLAVSAHTVKTALCSSLCYAGMRGNGAAYITGMCRHGWIHGWILLPKGSCLCEHLHQPKSLTWGCLIFKRSSQGVILQIGGAGIWKPPTHSPVSTHSNALELGRLCLQVARYYIHVIASIYYQLKF